jgi:hypothetical protein
VPVTEQDGIVARGENAAEQPAFLRTDEAEPAELAMDAVHDLQMLLPGNGWQ